MTIQEAIYSYLSAYAALTTYTSNRIYPEYLPQTPKYPCVTYGKVSENEVDTLEQPDTLIAPTIQFDCFATSSSTAAAMGMVIRDAFKNYSGLMGGSSGVTVSAIDKVSSIHNTYTDSDGRIIAHVTSADYQIWYQEA